ncbi:sigma-54-dependent transcriptional regulator [Thiorhodococcus minor]|uniref:Sigma-54-dependent Fis family transcriptional regulator n=1 Tax=Thiorhodococcus minor TaxID=57489 RepID=A0A6M0JSD7_9GAMM|nr:sigma-54 dependent transcriptional regulator [Thiorhodococcus minor]NEV60436.1 sigma-54-dependent Fis family transcriptional regulator [Thiorhodococcus minor]
MTQKALPVVLVDDEADLLLATSMLLGSHGVGPVVTLRDAQTLLPYLEESRAGVILLDLYMPNIGGLELLPQLVQDHPEVPVVVMTAAQDVETAVACMREGAFDYLVKPVEESRLVSAVRRALEVCSLRDQLGTLRASLLTRRLRNPDAFADIVTGNRRMEAIFQYMDAIADSPEPVLITGETGTGKELIASAIHRLSGRAGELIAINVAGLDDHLFADTLFGHVRGAFTGAERERQGAIASAAGGTLLLDEVGDLAKASQVKLLRLLQEQRYYPLGSDLQRVSDARIVAATNRPLHKRLGNGKFRQDLYFRLSSHPIEIPPLRQRRDDIPLLVPHFIEEAATSLGRQAPAPPEELITLLSVYEFPGNVRELRAMIYNAVAMHRSGPVLSMEGFRTLIERGRREGVDDGLPPHDGPPLAINSRFPTLKDAETYLIDEAMRRAKSNQGIAATLLGITRQSLNRRLLNRQRS